jgi:hypothetical protein
MLSRVTNEMFLLNNYPVIRKEFKNLTENKNHIKTEYQASMVESIIEKIVEPIIFKC